MLYQFNNKLILIDKKLMFWKTWYDIKFVTVQDLLINNGTIMTYNDFGNKYSNVEKNFLQLYQMISAIPKRWLFQGTFFGYKSVVMKILNIDVEDYKKNGVYKLIMNVC